MRAQSVRGWPGGLEGRRARATPAREIVVEDQSRLIRNLIWLYLILWLTEGGLRRWFLPSLATPLLFIRDPLVVVIYGCAMARGLFPLNKFIVFGVLLAIVTMTNGILLGHGNLLVGLYGARCDFLHIPLIFIMARVLRPKDLIEMARIAMVIAIPYAGLIVAQFYSPQSAWVNRGVGGSLDGAGFVGAMGRFRPPGTFSFITGTAQLYSLLTACWFALVLARKIPLWLMIGSGVAILMVVPLSVSRGLFLCVAFVASVGILALFIGGRFSGQLVVRAALAAFLLPFLAFQLPAVREGMQAFGARWQNATTESGGVQVAIVDRVLDDLSGPFSQAEGAGFGTGYSTNVGQKILTEEVGFGAAEGEWGRLLCDNGLLLGTLMVLYRASLAGYIVFAALRARRWQSGSGLVYAASSFLIVLSGQWGQSTTLGAAAICGGLALAASNPDELEDTSAQEALGLNLNDENPACHFEHESARRRSVPGHSQSRAARA